MTRLNMFNNVSLDGYFTDGSSDMSWAHAGLSLIPLMLRQAQHEDL